MASNGQRHLLRLTLSYRNIIAHVTNTVTDSIVAMASTTEQEFMSRIQHKIGALPKSRMFWDAKIASRIGEKLGFRLHEIGISHVEIEDLDEHSLPLRFRKEIFPFFHSIKQAGISVAGSEILELMEQKNSKNL